MPEKDIESTIYQNDRLYDLDFTLRDSAGVAIDLAGATLLLNVKRKNTAAVKFRGAMTVDDAASGTCHYTVQATNFDEAGIYETQVEITYESGTIITVGGYTLNVKEEI